MNKKDFIALADIIRKPRSGFRQLRNSTIIDELADFCESRNPKFDRKKWIAYLHGECEPNGGKIE